MFFSGDAEEPLYFTSRASICGGCGLIGIGARIATKDEMWEALDMTGVVCKGCHYLTGEEMAKARTHFPVQSKTYKGVIIGPLNKVNMPDLVIMLVNGDQLQMISTAYTYETGLIMQGNAGSAGFIMTVSIPLFQKRPTFTCGDHGVRNFGQMDAGEMLVCFPYLMVSGLVTNLKLAAEREAQLED